MKRLLIFLFAVALLAPAALFAQTTEVVYQLSGMILSDKKDEPLSFTRVRIGQTRRRTVADENGFFSIPVIAGDTLYFERLGYKRGMLVVSEYLKQYQGDKQSPYIYTIQYLASDDIELPLVNIYPYSNAQELKTAMLNVPMMPDDPAKLAQRNVSPELIAYMMNDLPQNDADRAAVAQRRYEALYRQRGTPQQVPLLDAVAVFRLIDYIGTKSKQKREKSYNYWPDEK